MHYRSGCQKVCSTFAARGELSKWLPQSYQDGVALIDPWSYCERAIDVVAKALTFVVGAVNTTLDADGSLGARFNSMWVGTDELRATSTALLGVGSLPRC